MATETSYLGLSKPAGTDAAAVSVINANMDLIDDAISATDGSIGIKNSGDTASQAIASGKYVEVRGHSTLADGVYLSKSSISNGATLSTSNLQPVGNGVANNILERMVDLIYPVGSVYMSFNSSMPSYLTSGKTWQAITGGYVLKTVTSGAGGTLTAAGNTGGHTLTTSEIPSHTHKFCPSYSMGNTPSTDGSHVCGSSNGSAAQQWAAMPNVDTSPTGGGGSHNHTAGMPANVAVYLWKRTA